VTGLLQLSASASQCVRNSRPPRPRPVLGPSEMDRAAGGVASCAWQVGGGTGERPIRWGVRVSGGDNTGVPRGRHCHGTSGPDRLLLQRGQFTTPQTAKTSAAGEASDWARPARRFWITWRMERRPSSLATGWSAQVAVVWAVDRLSIECIECVD
jgi:hypothetical protein